MLKTSNKPTINQSSSQQINISKQELKTNELKPLQTPQPYVESKERKRIFKQK